MYAVMSDGGAIFETPKYVALNCRGWHELTWSQSVHTDLTRPDTGARAGQRPVLRESTESACLPQAYGPDSR